MCIWKYSMIYNRIYNTSMIKTYVFKKCLISWSLNNFFLNLRKLKYRFWSNNCRNSICIIFLIIILLNMNLLNLRLLILRNLYLLFMLLNRFNCLIMLSNLLNSLNNWFILLLKYLRFLYKFIKYLILLIIPHYKL